MLIELFASLGVAAIVLAGFSATLVRVQRLEANLVVQSRGWIALNNTLERLAAEPAWNPPLAERILRDEIRNGPLGANELYTAHCTEDERSLILRITHRNGKLVSAVRLKQ